MPVITPLSLSPIFILVCYLNCFNHNILKWLILSSNLNIGNLIKHLVRVFIHQLTKDCVTTV